MSTTPNETPGDNSRLQVFDREQLSENWSQVVLAEVDMNKLFPWIDGSEVIIPHDDYYPFDPNLREARVSVYDNIRAALLRPASQDYQQGEVHFNLAEAGSIKYFEPHQGGYIHWSLVRLSPDQWTVAARKI